MGRLKYYSMIPNDKPEWLLRLQMAISQRFGGEWEDSQYFWEDLKQFVIDELWTMLDNRGCKAAIRSKVTIDLVTDEGKTVLHIKRNRIVVQTYWIEKD